MNDKIFIGIIFFVIAALILAGIIIGYFLSAKKTIGVAILLSIILPGVAYFSLPKGSEDRGFFPLSIPMWLILGLIVLLIMYGSGCLGESIRYKVHGKKENEDLDGEW